MAAGADPRPDRHPRAPGDERVPLGSRHLFPNDVAGHAEAIPAAQRTGPVCPLDTGVDLSRSLTGTGRAVVERMLERRRVVDVTHCTPVARREVYELVANRAPVIASHNGVHSLNPEAYNLDETDVRAIAASGGVVGVIFMPYWLESSHPGPGLEGIWRTMEQLRDWSGGSWDHVAIGTDFDGFTDPPDDCNDASRLPVIRELLESRASRAPAATPCWAATRGACCATAGGRGQKPSNSHLRCAA